MMFNARRLKMNRSAFSALVVAAALGGSLYNATGQMINPTVQTASTRVVASRSAPATAGKASRGRACSAAGRGPANGFKSSKV